MLKQTVLIILLIGLIISVSWRLLGQIETFRTGNLPPVDEEDDGDFERAGGPGRDRGAWRGEAIRNGWMLVYQEALAAARAADKPLMIVFRCIP